MAEDGAGTTFGRVTVIGTGLLGCSVAALLRGRAVAEEVIGVDRDRAHLEMAQELGFIERGFDEPGRGVMGAHAVVLAVPLDEVFKVMDAIGPDVRPGALIACLAGATGRLRHQLVRHVRSAENFVPAYPLIHRLGSGPGGASPAVLDGQPCLVATGEPIPAKAAEEAAGLMAGLGCEVERLGLEAFEAAVAGHRMWPDAVAVAAARVAGRGGWPEGRSRLHAWLEGVAAPDELDRCHQLYASRVCGLIDELIVELQEVQRYLGAAPAPPVASDGPSTDRSAPDQPDQKEPTDG